MGARASTKAVAEKSIRRESVAKGAQAAVMRPNAAGKGAQLRTAAGEVWTQTTSFDRQNRRAKLQHSDQLPPVLPPQQPQPVSE